MTTQTVPAPTCVRPSPAGIVLPCPMCGDVKARIALRLARLGDGDEIRCEECDAEFGLAEIRDLIEKWSKVIAWVDAIPQFGADK